MYLQLPVKDFYKINASCQKRQQTDIKTTELPKNANLKVKILLNTPGIKLFR